MQARARRRLAGAATLGVVTAIALAGCTRPAGVDGDLTNAWPSFAKAVSQIPAVGACYSRDYTDTWSGPFGAATVACSTTHRTETVFVGTFSGADASRSTPPPRGTSRASAYGQCQKAANAYLGGDWHGAYVDLGIVVPSDQAWAGGARWYRCDLMRTTRDLDATYIESDNSLKDGLRGSRADAITCATVTDGGTSTSSITSQEATACSRPHNGEFAGAFSAPAGSWPASATKRDDLARRGCTVVAARFLGIADFNSSYVGLGLMWSSFNEDRWDVGDRASECFVIGVKSNGSVNGVTFVGSLKGIGTAKPQGWKA